MAMALDEVVNQGAQNEINYVRYWMGFRIFIRPLLLLDSYYGIRRIVSSVFFMLFLAATLTLAQKVDRKTAVCFGVAVTLVNPAIISQSLQFTCVFILSFLFIIALCHLKDRIPLPYLFCAFGALTQLFDFYTAPVLTFGLPMLVWLMRKPDAKKPLITVFQLLLAWGFGYVSMWLVKLALVTVFTDINGFTDGLHRLAQRTGFAEMEEPTENYTPIMALRAVWTTAFPYPWGKPVLLVIAAALALSAVIFWKKGGWSCLWSKASFGLIAAVPVIWFLCSAQPTCIHAWFQYRSLAATFFAVALFVASAGELAFAKKIPQVNKDAPE